MRHLRHLRPLACGLLLAAPAAAQGSGITSPGMPATGSGQTDRFSREFNPAISLAFDAYMDYVELDGAGDEGTHLELRSAEVLASAWIDPTAWIYATVASDGEELALEEASLQYLGLGDAHTLRVGRFFLDFGKQMQAHVHDLRTFERPLVLRELLGEEVKGDGLQWDWWSPAGDVTVVRTSLGVFQSLTPHEHGSEHGAAAGAEPWQEDRRDLGKLDFSGRVTALRDVGTNGQVQVGLSTRLVPELAYEDPASGNLSASGSNSVWGLDLTYGWVDDTATKSWTFGGEYLRANGALSAEVDLASNVVVNDGDASGYYLFLDHGLDRQSSVGAQYSRCQLVEAGAGDAREIDVYYTHYLSEFLRLRFSAGYADYDASPDALRLVIQLTGFVGPHDHGINW
ncbi:MAG: hypothetical protein H6828_00100 [Planctomycetes bacterium]|nr:hypothetical protein [Planctomycetota bacterium]